MKRFFVRFLFVFVATLLVVPVSMAQELTVYSGRSKGLVQPILQQFTEDTGIRVQVRYGATAQLALALREEGPVSPADVFWAQDAGALGSLVKAGLLAELPESIVSRVPETYRSPTGRWVATSGRARVLAFSPGRVAAGEIPDSVFDLTHPRYRGRVGWAPTNASFQAFVTAMRRVHGEGRTRQWLEQMKANATRAYPKNTAIIEAIAAGEIDLGLPNHYYLLRFKADDPDYPVQQTAFAPGDIGNLINVAGVGVVKSSDNTSAAHRLVRYLLNPEAQRYFEQETHEYAVVGDAGPGDGDAVGPNDAAPEVDLDDLDDLRGTLSLLREVGLL